MLPKRKAEMYEPRRRNPYEFAIVVGLIAFATLAYAAYALGRGSRQYRGGGDGVHGAGVHYVVAVGRENNSNRSSSYARCPAFAGGAGISFVTSALKGRK